MKGPQEDSGKSSIKVIVKILGERNYIGLVSEIDGPEPQTSTNLNPCDEILPVVMLYLLMSPLP